MEEVKAYVLINKDGKIISRPFGSKAAALWSSKYKRFEDQFYAIREVSLSCNVVEPEKVEVNHGRIT